MTINSIVIATHSFSPGTSQALQDYLTRENKEVLFIEHPLFANVFIWAIGALDTLWKVIRTRKKFDLYVGSNNLNAFMGIILKKLGFVKRVVFFTPDYSINRFDNFILNHIYLWMDFFCLRNADLVWNSSSIMPVDLMVLEREKRGIPYKYRNKQFAVPDGTDDIKTPFLEDIDRFKIGFVGHLKEKMGLELLIDAFNEVCNQIPQSKLVIIGSGPLEKYLRKKSKGLNIEFTGFVGELSGVYRLLSDCAIGIAPYEKNTISQYTDPGKVKIYLSLGLPIVISRVPRVATEIEKMNCGIAFDPDNKKELISAVLRLLKDDVFFYSCRINSLKLAEEYRWDKVFERAFSFLDIKQ